MADGTEEPAPGEDELALRELHDRIVAHQRAIDEHLDRGRREPGPPG